MLDCLRQGAGGAAVSSQARVTTSQRRGLQGADAISKLSARRHRLCFQLVDRAADAVDVSLELRVPQAEGHLPLVRGSPVTRERLADFVALRLQGAKLVTGLSVQGAQLFAGLRPPRMQLLTSIGILVVGPFSESLESADPVVCDTAQRLLALPQPVHLDSELLRGFGMLEPQLQRALSPCERRRWRRALRCPRQRLSPRHWLRKMGVSLAQQLTGVLFRAARRCNRRRLCKDLWRRSTGLQGHKLLSRSATQQLSHLGPLPQPGSPQRRQSRSHYVRGIEPPRGQEIQSYKVGSNILSPPPL
mmetsp:Transcript_56288/g.156818  ORF Transcript_56288/g.156818 Transcript_56288/m.156818 type:complete len:303 (+) Transcript_56288:1138-2046(+)